MNYDNPAKKKKKTIIYLISGILVVAIIGTIIYFAWPKSKLVENKKQKIQSEIRALKTQLNSVKSKLGNLSDTTKKTQLASKLSNLESQVNNLSENPNKSVIEKLAQKIKEIKEKIAGNKPNEKSEAKVKFASKSLKENGDFDYKFVEGSEHIFYVSKNHPQIKELLKENKLQHGKLFTIRYGKIDHQSDEEGCLLTFNEFNAELEISEIENPSPKPSPNPQPDKSLKWTSTKINNDTYKYKITLNNGSEIDFANFIIFLRTKDKDFFQAFQGALKDANSKFPAYFWKCPPVSKNTLDKPFEFVVIRSDSFNNIPQTPFRFQEHFGKSQDNQAVSFFSPSGNCLISPVPKGTADYINISQFTKNAPDEQQQALWKEVVDSLMKELHKDADVPRWLNTEGRGIYYLHVRIDKSNRFYSNYPEYAKWE